MDAPPPTQPGWYWAQRKGEDPQVVEVYTLGSDHLYVAVTLREWPAAVDEFERWSAELPKAQLP